MIIRPLCRPTEGNSHSTVHTTLQLEVLHLYHHLIPSVMVDLSHATSVMSRLLIGFVVIESCWLHWRKEKSLCHFAWLITSVNILLFAHHAQHHSKMHLLIQTSANTDIENKSWFCQLLTDIYLVSAVVSVIFTGWMDIFIWLSKE